MLGCRLTFPEFAVWKACMTASLSECESLTASVLMDLEVAWWICLMSVTDINHNTSNTTTYNTAAPHIARTHAPQPCPNCVIILCSPLLSSLPLSGGEREKGKGEGMQYWGCGGNVELWWLCWREQKSMLGCVDMFRGEHRSLKVATLANGHLTLTLVLKLLFLVLYASSQLANRKLTCVTLS